MVNVNPRTGLVYSGVKSPGDVSLVSPPGSGYKLKSDWESNIESPWEFDPIILRERIRKEVTKQTEERLQEIISYYPKGESETWASKSIQAKSWLALTTEQKEVNLTNTDYAMIFTEATGGTPAEDDIGDIDSLCERILINKSLFESYSGKILKRKTDILRQAQTDTTEEALNTIYNTITFEDIAFGA